MRECTEVFLPTLYSLVFVLGLPGNGLVVCVLLWFRHKCNLTEICLLNLALSDLLFVLSLPFYAHSAVCVKWPWDLNVCRLTETLYSLGFYASIGFMVVMTLERYLLIVHSPFVNMWHTRRLSMVLIAVVWMLSLVVSLPNIFYVVINKNGESSWCQVEFPTDIMRTLDYIKINILGFILPLSIMVFCYSRIIPIVIKMRTQRKHKAIKLIFIIIITFFLFWTPYHVLIFLYMLRDQGHFPDPKLQDRLKIAIQWTETIGYCHCCLNPIIYAFVGDRFSQLVVNMLGQWLPGRPWRRPEAETSEATIHTSPDSSEFIF